MRVALVTGATGCLGQALCAELAAQGVELRTLSRHEGGRPDAPVARHLAMDLGAAPPPADMLEGVDVVFHCAALSSAWGRAAEFEAANIAATRHLLEAAREARVPRLVFASTPSIYINGQDRLTVAEDAALPQQFLTDYARTKYAAEEAVRAANGPDLTTVTIRPRAIYGKHDRALMPRLLRVMERGPVPLIGGGRALIDPTHNSDAARAMVLAARAPGPVAGGRAYNITSGEALPFADLVARLAGALHVPLRTRAMPYSVAMGLARLLEGAHRVFRPSVEPLLTRHAVAALGLSLTLDISAARRDLCYAPQVGLADGLADLARIYRHD
ncbi:MAG: NAD-dependent epimerase/dehydratase family protein [Paracoccus sp. (in: a-proteobacteria)]|nr:NAD-dependent epimerase/dehydratase family protein [Paracoccus sp. (in: a-proteobacteria)]